MNPLSPKQILRNLENGFFMTHQEQAETAQYIRQLQQAVLDEREACAKLCDLFARSSANVPSQYEFMGESAEECAKLIRERGNHGR